MENNNRMLTWFIPALVKRRVGSSNETVLELGQKTWLRLRIVINEYLTNVLAGEGGVHVGCEGNTGGVAGAVGFPPGIPGLKSQACVCVFCMWDV